MFAFSKNQFHWKIKKIKFCWYVITRGEFYLSEPTQDEYLAYLLRACLSGRRIVFSMYLPMHKSIKAQIRELDYNHVWKNYLEVESSKGQTHRAATQVIWQQFKLSGNKRALELCEWNQGQLSAVFVQKMKTWDNFPGEEAGTPRVPLCRGCHLPAAPWFFGKCSIKN